MVTFIPADWFVAADADVPNGAHVAYLSGMWTLGLINGPCTAALSVDFDMIDATTNTSVTATFDRQFEDADGNTLPDGVDRYPDFLVRMLSGATPRARYYGQASVAGATMSLNLLVFEPGAVLPGLPHFDPGLGYPTLTVLSDHGDPGALGAPGAITDFCAPLDIAITTYGISIDDSGTASNEGGFAVRRNPGLAGTYSFSTYARSSRDVDGDGIENQLDTCPYLDNAGDPRVPGSGDQDNDGLDDACDPGPTVTMVDQDSDGYTNRGDNCPLAANPDNADTDVDGIGDACDGNAGVPDGRAEERALSSIVTITATP